MNSRRRHKENKVHHWTLQPAPSLWQDNSTEKVIQLLVALDLPGTLNAFQHWQCQPEASDPNIRKKEPALFAAASAAQDWQKILMPWSNTGRQLRRVTLGELTGLLDYFQAYDFGKWLTGFRSSLLQLLYRLTQDHLSALSEQETTEQIPPRPLYENIKRITELLLYKTKKRVNTAQTVDLVSLALKTFAHDGRLIYLLAGCLYQHQNKKEAYKRYAQAMLTYPDLADHFKEKKSATGLPTEITTLLRHQSYPPKAAILGIIQGLFEFIDMPQSLSTATSEHQAAIDFYRDMQLAEKLYRAPKKDNRKITQARERLLKRDPVLYQKYLNWIEKRENR